MSWDKDYTTIFVSCYSAWEMLSHQGVDIKLLAEVFPEHFTALAKDYALVRRLEIEGIN